MKTENPIVVAISGGERCATTLEELQAAAKVIYTKAVRASGTSANISTLGVEIEGQIRLINAESDPSEMEAPTP